MANAGPISGCRSTRIYCRPGCPAGRRTKTESKVYFRSTEEARTEGYRACKICKPDEPAREPETFCLTNYQSPLGVYILASSDEGIVCVKPEEQAQTYLERWKRARVAMRGNGALNLDLKTQFDAYFAGGLRRFTIPLDLRGTSFQRRVWGLLAEIPWGETRSYLQIAEALGSPKAARAVGRAVGTNPISIVIPCHRVIGSDGSLTGYGGGLERKIALLEIEGRAGSTLAC